MKLQLYGNKLMHHPDAIQKWKEGKPFPPIFIEFGPVIGCNHKCKHCYIKNVSNKTILLEEKIYLRFMKEIGEFGVKSVILAGCGEPMMHKATPKAIKVGNDNGVDIGMFTNGIPIKDEDIPILMDNLTFIRFTINGCSEKSYTTIHSCKSNDWFKVKSNIKKCVEYKKKMDSKCTIGVYTLLQKENVDELKDWVEEVKYIGVDYIIIKPPGKGIDGNQYVEVIDYKPYEEYLHKISNMGNSKFIVEIRWDVFESGYPKLHKECLGLPFMCAVDADGSIYACTWTWGNSKFKYGNLYDNTFEKIWNSKNKDIIMQMINTDYPIECEHCASRHNSINRYLWELANPPDHINFI